MRKVPKRVRRQSDKGNRHDNYISLPQACKLLFLTDSSVRYYIAQHRIKAFKSGGRWYLCKNDVMTFKEWHETR